MNKFNVNSRYFDPLLRYYGIYASTDISLNQGWNFTTNLSISSGILNINVSKIPVRIDISNSQIILNSTEDISVSELILSGNNTLVVNGDIKIITKNLTISGNLYITGLNDTLDEFVIFEGTSGIFGNFTNVKVNNISKCKKYKVEYRESQILILFSSTKEPKCPGGPGEPEDISEPGNLEDNYMLIIIISIVCLCVTIIIVVTTILLKVKWCRERVFPHRDRAVFKPATPKGNTSN
jgi:hypothetical protein